MENDIAYASPASGRALPPAESLPLIRTRLALALVAATGIALELVLMRGLAIRFSSHFAGIVISVGLLGFGAAGSMLTLFRALVLRHQRSMLLFLALALAVCVPVTWTLSQRVPLNVNHLATSMLTDHQELWRLLAIEVLMVIPFSCAGAFIGIALMDLPRRINGHYASDLLGSGLGGVAVVLAMGVLPLAQLLLALSIAGVAAAAFLIRVRSGVHWAMIVLALAVTLSVPFWMPPEPAANPYKGLTLARLFAGTREIYTDQGPLGRIDVVTGPELHGAPQLSLAYVDEPPPHVEIYIDGDGPQLLYNTKEVADWSFADFRTAAAAYQLLPAGPKVCVIEAGGGVEIGTALYHQSHDITGLELNPQIIRMMEGPLARRGGNIYTAAGVHIVNAEARGFFAATDQAYDIIQFPALGSAGAAGADATQENYLYTTQSVRAMIHHLSGRGILSITRTYKLPPREELRAFDLAAQALRGEGLDPATHLAMIRSLFSTTILVFKAPVTADQTKALRTFSGRMSFDLCYLPGLKPEESNVSNIIAGSDPYYPAAQALVAGGAAREKFLSDELFNLAAPADDAPYFFHFFQWRTWNQLQQKTGQNPEAFLEVSYVMLLVALTQAVVLAFVLILVPLAPGIRALRAARGKAACLGYFLMLGVGFMLLEMGFVQKLVLYLSHPIYAAAVAIASFLVFAGLGSQLSHSWGGTPRRVVPIAAGVTIGFGLLYLLGIDWWLGLTQAWPVAARCLVAALTIAPLAFAMGHFFPLGLQRVSAAQPAIVPWAWAINGFASVFASAATPLLAMNVGFSRVVLLSMGCYLAAGLLFRAIPATAAVARGSKVSATA